jgi:TatD DNase family protein
MRTTTGSPGFSLSSECTTRLQAWANASGARRVSSGARASTGPGLGVVGGVPVWACDLFDVDCNLTHEVLLADAEAHVARARAQGVSGWLVPGSSVEDGLAAVELTRRLGGVARGLFATVGVHPYNAEAQLERLSVAEALANMRAALGDGAVAVGECGLDLSPGFPALATQERWFAPQVELACELGLPLFLHERLAHEPVMQVLRKQRARGRLPDVLVHCFTGSARELAAYLELGCFVSVAGLICRADAGRPLREALQAVGGSRAPQPQRALLLDRIMVETDAPYMGFPGCQDPLAPATTAGAKPAMGRSKSKPGLFPNAPFALVRVLAKLAETLDVEPLPLALATTANAKRFLRLAA